MRLPIGIVALAIGVAIEAVAPARAQEAGPSPALRLVEPEFSEDYAPQGTRGLHRLSPRVIVGLHLGHGAGPFWIDKIAVPLGAAKDPNYCVSLSSGDARYRSVNRYQRSSDPGAARIIETHSRYGEDLARAYQAEDVAIKITVSSHCGEDDDLKLVPALPPGRVSPDTLVVFVNSRGSRANVSVLDRKGATIATGACSPADPDKVVTFSEICAIPLSESSLAAPLRLRVGLLGESPQIFDLMTGGK